MKSLQIFLKRIKTEQNNVDLRAQLKGQNMLTQTNPQQNKLSVSHILTIMDNPNIL